MKGELEYTADKTFDHQDNTKNPIRKGHYENCIFKRCDFRTMDLSEFVFTECRFTGCDLSLVKLNKTLFQDIQFKECKMIGMQFDNCYETGLSFSFEGCQLNHSSFYGRKIRGTTFMNTQLLETDFTESDLTDSIFKNCDLSGAVFDHTLLAGSDLRTSFNYSIDPGTNRIHKAKFSMPEVLGLLDIYGIEID